MTNTAKINDQQVRWGIIGVGDVCEKKSAPAMQLVANSSIEAVMRRNAAKAADYARRHQIDKWYDDADQLINDPRVNAIYIATPPSSHQEYTLRAAQAGKPVYVEKPMALDHAQCLQMIDHCDRHQVPLYVAYYRRALPNFLKVKEIVDQGILGEIRFVRISLFQSARWDLEHPVGNWRVNPQISGGGHFVDLASHQFDFLDFVFGPLEQVWGATENQGGLYPAEDLVSASFRWRSGVVGQGLWCFTAPENAEEETVQIVGSKGKLSFACFGSPNLLLELAGQEPVEMTFAYPQHIQQPLIEQIIADLLGYGEAVSTGITAARTNLVMDRILKTV